MRSSPKRFLSAENGLSRADEEVRLGLVDSGIARAESKYFRLDESAVLESEEVQPGIILDFNAEGKVVGIEILDLSTRVAPEQLRVLQFETE